MTLLRSTETVFANEVEVLVVGAGACGMTAAMAASEQGCLLYTSDAADE